MEHFKRSLDALEHSLRALEMNAGHLNSDVVEANESGIIQHFEVSKELSWKIDEAMDRRKREGNRLWMDYYGRKSLELP